jgi:phosphatidylinositol-3,4,5-trisphosphate 3-phosphatase/dual-specificity protein phosphatase PTEN
MENFTKKCLDNITENSIKNKIDLELNQSHDIQEKNTADNKEIDVESLIKMTKEKVSLGIKKSNSIFQTNVIKSMISKKKCRFEYEGFSLDLTYITEKIIAMGFPSEKVEKIYRNGIEEVKKFFHLRHGRNYKVYNLCSEREYPNDTFENQAHYPFDDHEAPPLKLILPFCLDVDEWLGADPNNIAAIHCKAGKGRTGTMICCYLLYNNIMKTADDAIKFYGSMRTTNGKGVTIPSQLRYIYYFEEILKMHVGSKEIDNFCIPSPKIFITKLKFYTIPYFGLLGNKKCRPDFIIENQNSVYKYKEQCQGGLKSYYNEAYAEFIVNKYAVLGDVRIKFFNKKTFGIEKMFSFWFHTYLIPKDGSFQIKKSMLDVACKDRSNKFYDPNFKIEVQFIFEEESFNW